MTTLDHRLYAWLIESDERRFESAFSSYFSLAFPAVVRQLVRLSRWDSAKVEEIAQDALLKFFDRVGRDRREALEAIKKSLTGVRPLNFGPFHERQVNRWALDVSSLRDAVVSFQVPEEDLGGAQWKSEIRALTDRIPLLQGQGGHLVHAVRLELNWRLHDEHSIETTPEEFDSNLALDCSDQSVDERQRDFTEQLARESEEKTARAVIAEKQHPGVVRFVACTVVVLGALPRVRVPTNSFLFEIATTLYLDECKKHARQKRGGTGVSTQRVSSATAKQESLSQHPLELMPPDINTDFDGDEFFDAFPTRTIYENSSLSLDLPTNDPTRRYEDEEFLAKFYDHLRRPVDEATEAYERALATGRASTERRKLEILTDKFSRTISVLSMMGDGYTQEQTAERLGISRNQVKYIIELVREAYARFATESARSTTGLSGGRGQSYV